MTTKVRNYLIIILVLTGAVPFIASYFAVKSFSNYQTELARDLSQDNIHDRYSAALKKLSRFDTSNKESYKKEFLKLQDSKILINNKNDILKVVSTSIGKVYIIIFGGFVLILILIGTYLSKIITRIYESTYLELQDKKQRELHLKQFEKISDIVKSLNHELKKPLAPIEAWNQNLISAFKRKSPNLGEVIKSTNSIISDEVNGLKRLINSFNDYTSLPEPIFDKVNVTMFFDEQFEKLKQVYEEVEVIFDSQLEEIVYKDIDKNLISQVLQNLIENAIEANPGEKVKIECLLVESQNSHIELHFKNIGKPLDLSKDLFEFGVTSKTDSEGSGIGLALTKITLLKHGGDITIVPFDNGAYFKLVF